MVTMAMIAMMKDLVEGDHVHDDHDDHCSASGMFSLSTVQCSQYSGCSFGLYDVAASSLIGLFNFVLISDVTPFFWSSYVILPFQSYPVKFFHVELRVSLFAHAHVILLVLEVALHDHSAIVLLRGIQLISCSFEFL